MELTDEIRTRFSSRIGEACWPAGGLDKRWPAWILRQGESFGVAVEYDGPKIDQEFADARLCSETVNYPGLPDEILVLRSRTDSSRNEFAILCADFINPGSQGEKRKALTADPYAWWQRWSFLTGNRMVEKSPYQVIGELLTLQRLYTDDKSTVWSGPNHSSHDIQTDTADYEVKSTTRRYKREMTVNSQFQLTGNVPLFLDFYRFESSQSGISINSLAADLKQLDPNDTLQLEDRLRKLGYPEGEHAREQKYLLHEALEYEIGEDFPLISPASFKENRIPDGITQITYTVDLNSAEPVRVLEDKTAE